jgi:uncharacterized protein
MRMTTAPIPGRSAERRDLVVIVCAIAVAMVLLLVFGRVARTGVVSGALQVLLADLCVWVPLAGAVFVAVRGLGVRGALGRLGLMPGGGVLALAVDVVFGVAAGLLVRAFDAFLSLALYGSSGLVPGALLVDGPVFWLAVLAVAGPVVVSPILEELAFRGVFQRAFGASLGGGFWGWTTAVLVTSVLFAFAHRVIGTASVGPVVLTTFVLGLCTGALAAATGRVRASIVAHVVFNGVAVALTWPY